MKSEGRMTNPEWPKVALDEVATIERSAIQPEAISQGTAYLGLEHIESGGKILGAKPVDEGELASSKFKFTDRHVLYGKLRPYLAKIACPDFTGICSTDILPILPGPKLERRFLCYFLRQPSMVDYANSRAAGANLPRLSPSALAEFELPLPPLAEQRRIAEVLDRAEVLRAKRRATLAQLDSLTQSLFLDLFGDPRINEHQWPMYPIRSFISDMRGGAALEPDDFVESGFPILHKGAIKAQGVIGMDAKKKTFASLAYAESSPQNIVNRDFVAVTLRDLVPAGPSIGLTADLRNGPFDEYLLAQGAYGFRVDESKVAPEFLVHISNNKNFRHVLKQNAVGSTQIHIRTPVYLAIRIPLPPITLQREFARRVTAVEKLKAAQRASLAELDALFATLQHRAFQGEL